MSYTPVSGGYNWRQEVVSVIQSEKEGLDAMRNLLRYAENREASVIVGTEIARYALRIDRLHTMLQTYQDRKEG